MMLTLVGLSQGMLEDSARRAQGVGADIMVRSPGTSLMGGSANGINQKMLAWMQQQPHVRMVAGQVVHGIGGISTATGIDLDEFNRMSGGFKYIAGGPFRGEQDIIVDQFYANQNGLKVGSPLKLMGQDWRVCGIVEPGKLARVVLPRARLQDLAAATGMLSQIWVKLDDPANTNIVIASLKEKLPDYPMYSVEELTSLVLRQQRTGLERLHRRDHRAVDCGRLPGGVPVHVHGGAGAHARDRDLEGSGRFTGLRVEHHLPGDGIARRGGGGLGILLTYGSRWAIMTLVPASLTQKIVPGWWPIAGAIAVVGALFGAIYPAWKAARQDAIEALSYE